jgi:putative heme iron utilization protein
VAQPNTDVLQPVDRDARRLAKTLTRTARFAALASLESSDGHPAVSRVSIVTAMNGDVGFLISGLAGHFGNLEADQRCSLLIGEPGKGDPLAHPRLTLIGRARKLIDGSARAHFRARFLMRHPKSALYADFADFAFWQFAVARASLNAGFGKAFALTPADLTTGLAGLEALAEVEAGAVAHMNSGHADAVDHYARQAGGDGTGWRLACIDPEGLDLMRGDKAARLWFETLLTSPEQLRPALVALAKA